MGDALVGRGLLSQDALQKALATQFQSGLRLGEILIGMGLIREQDLTDCLAEQYGFEIVDVSTIKPEPDALALVSSGFALAHLILPLTTTKSELKCAIADPLDIVATDATAQAVHRRLTVVLAGPTQLYNAIQTAYGLGESIGNPLAAEAVEIKPQLTIAPKSKRGRDTQEDRRALLALISNDQPAPKRAAA